jgi:hypothetical protein
MLHISEIRGFKNAVLQQELLQKVEKEINLVSLSAKERLVKFKEKYPELMNITPHIYLASYLGINNNEFDQ